MAGKRQEKIGFTTGSGNYEWTKMPSGLINTSQRVMDPVASGLQQSATCVDGSSPAPGEDTASR